MRLCKPSELELEPELASLDDVSLVLELPPDDCNLLKILDKSGVDVLPDEEPPLPLSDWRPPRMLERSVCGVGAA